MAPGLPGRDPDVRRRALQLARIGAVALVVVVALVALGVNRYEQVAKERTEAQAAQAGTGWPEAVNGRPNGLGDIGTPAGEVTPTTDPGVYLWSDFDGWHLWVAGGAGLPAEITGTLVSDDALTGVDLAIPGAGATEAKGQQVSFTLPTDRPVTGLGFSTGFFAKELEVRLQGPDGPLDPSFVHLGSDLQAAPDPLVIAQGTG